jgi:hypothetical protein
MGVMMLTQIKQERRYIVDERSVHNISGQAA